MAGAVAAEMTTERETLVSAIDNRSRRRDQALAYQEAVHISHRHRQKRRFGRFGYDRQHRWSDARHLRSVGERSSCPSGALAQICIPQLALTPVANEPRNERRGEKQLAVRASDRQLRSAPAPD